MKRVWMVVAIACATLMASCGSTEKKATEQTEACAKANETKIEVVETTNSAEVELVEATNNAEKVRSRIKDIRTAERQYKSRH